MSDFRFIQIKRPDVLIGNWHDLHQGIVEVLKHVKDEDYGYTNVLNELSQGHSALFVGLRDGRFVGFVVAKPCKIEFGPTYLMLPMMYTNHLTQEEWDSGIEILGKWAKKEFNIQYIEFWSSRNGFEKMGPKIGFHEAYRVYRKEV